MCMPYLISFDSEIDWVATPCMECNPQNGGRQSTWFLWSHARLNVESQFDDEVNDKTCGLLHRTFEQKCPRQVSNPNNSTYV